MQPTNWLEYCNKSITASLPAWKVDICNFIHDWKSESEIIRASTSGSTGAPKPIELHKDAMSYSAQATCNFFQINSSSRLLLCLPARYIAGKMMIARSFVSGSHLIATEPVSDPLGNVSEPFDFVALTPQQLFNSIDYLQKRQTPLTIIVGGGEISPDLEKKAQYLSSEIYATYGMTETCSHIALRRVNGSNRSDYFKTIGHTRVHLDERACLVINNEQLNANNLITNDIAEAMNSHTFRWLGRFDNVINSGGVKIMPEEIENSVEKATGLAIMVTSVPDDILGERLVWMIKKDESSNINWEHTINSLKKSDVLPKYHYPGYIGWVKEFPLTAVGKPNRQELKKLVLAEKSSLLITV